MNQKKHRLLLLFIIILVYINISGCVYYNTFYNARKAFNSAEKARKADSYRGGNVNQAQYKIAIDKSLKIIENYPNSKWYDDALYVIAVSYFHTEKYSKAERRFRELLANYSDSKYAKESEVYLAKTKLSLREEEAAMQLFENIFISDFNKEYKTEAAMALGSYYNEKNDYNSAIRYYQAVRDSLGNDQQKKIAQLYIADDYFNLFQFKNALSAYKQLLGMNPDKNEKYLSLVQSTRCSYQLMKIQDGLDYLNTLINDDIYFDSLGTLKLMAGEGYEYKEEIALAEETYLAVTELEASRPVLGQAYYRLGLIYQFDYDNLQEAKQFYDKTAEYDRGSETGRDALQRSADIGKLDVFARNIEIDSTTSQDKIDEAGFTQYKLAELYWFNLNKPDTAMLEMQYLIDSFPTAYDVPKAMIALSQMYRDYKSDTTSADSILMSLLEKYPHSDIIPEALDILGLKGTDVDSGYAQIYIEKAESFFADDSTNIMVDSAKYYYQYIVDNYPNSEYYLQARFGLIWLMEMYESPGDSTVIWAYNSFIDSFPNTNWANEAQKRTSYRPRRIQQEILDSTQYAENGEYGEEGQRSGQESGVNPQDTSSYVDPMTALYIGPNGEEIKQLPLEPVQVEEPFVYPTEAYTTAWEGDLYFQVYLDFSGDVIDNVLKIRSESEDINREATKAVASMTFDYQRIPIELQGSWLVYKFKVRLPDFLR